MKKYILLTILFSLTQLVLAEDTPDKIYLRSGSIFSCKIIDNNRHSVRFRYPSGVEEEASMDYVWKLHQQKPRMVPRGWRFFLETGYNFTPTTLHDDRDDYTLKDSPFVNLIIGCQIWHIFYFGVGSGIDFYNGKVGIPLYGDIRFNLLKRRVAPIIDFLGGYDFGIKGEMMNPRIGINVMLSKKTSLAVLAGYKYQYATFYGTIDHYWNTGKEIIYQYSKVEEDFDFIDGFNFSISFGW